MLAESTSVVVEYLSIEKAFPAESGPAEGELAESVLAEGVVAENVLAENVLAESDPAENALAESGFVLPDCIKKWRLVEKIRRHMKELNPYSLMYLRQQYFSMAFSRTLAIWTIAQIPMWTTICKQEGDDDLTSDKECRGYVIALVVLGILCSSITDAVWAASMIGHTFGFRYHWAVEMWLQAEIVLGLLHLHLWFYITYPLVFLLKLILGVFCIRKIGKVWVTRVILS